MIYCIFNNKPEWVENKTWICPDCSTSFTAEIRPSEDTKKKVWVRTFGGPIKEPVCKERNKKQHELSELSGDCKLCGLRKEYWERVKICPGK